VSSRNGIRLRRMRQEDAPAVLEILGQYDMAPRPPSAEVPDPERSGIAVENTLVAEKDGAIVGVGSYLLHAPRLAETASLAVHADHRGSNVGSLLQEARLEEMRARGVETVRTEADRPATVAWYVRKFGYRVIGTNPKKHAFSLPDVDQWTVLELDLASWPGPSTR
jgi:N-acetylglutamate synthase-like GNAT family acetyltransferase